MEGKRDMQKWKPTAIALIMIVVLLVIVSMVYYYSFLNDDVVSGTGTIAFLGFEGGFFGIIGDDGEHYDPINLDEEFQVDGLRVSFKARILENQVSVHMWGTRVEIKEIHKL